MARARRAGEEALLFIKVNSKPYRVFRSRLTAVDIGDLRRATGGNMGALLKSVVESPDLDTVAAIMWLARRQNGEPRLSYDDVAAEVDGAVYEQMSAGVEEDEAEGEVDGSPEA